MKNNNNKGFTLIEILVAVIALGLVVMPLLQGFVSTANLNKKSREKMMATNVAQSIMERYSTSTIKEIATELNPGTDFVEDASHQYNYSIVNYPHNGNNYDIKVSIDASSYYGTGSTAFNSNGYATITSVDTAKDAIYAENERVLKDALDEFVDRNRAAITVDNKTITKEQFEKKLERTIRVVIEDKVESGETHTEVNIYYEFKAPSGWVDPGDREYSKSLNIYTNQNIPISERKPLRNVYILFRPYYSKPYYEGFADKFVIKNETNKDFNMYLIKLITGDEADLESNESVYSASINVYENTLTENYTDIGYRGHTKVFTNLGYNMALEDNKSTTAVDERVVATQVKYFYWPSNTISVDGRIENDYFVPEYTGERMYKMKVEVFPAGAKANGFPAEQKLAELSN